MARDILDSDPETLVDRLRGIYRISITDGLGPVGAGEEPNNPDAFVRRFETAPIMHEAAAEIEQLRAALACGNDNTPTLLSALKAMDAALTNEWGSPKKMHSPGDPCPEAWIQIRSAIAQADGR